MSFWVSGRYSWCYTSVAEINSEICGYLLRNTCWPEWQKHLLAPPLLICMPCRASIITNNWAALQLGSSIIWTLTAGHTILLTFMIFSWCQWGCLLTYFKRHNLKCRSFSISDDSWTKKSSSLPDHMLNVHRQQLEKK